MSIDRLQERIRKTKNPSVVAFDMIQDLVPDCFRQNESFFPDVFERYAKKLLDGLKDHVPAVRFSLNQAAAYGAEGVITLKELLRYAKELGYYVLLDGPAALCAEDAQISADNLFTPSWKFDGLVITAYIGSDAIRPYAQRLEQEGRGLFVVARTANRSCQELQDLLTGSRLVYQAAADVISRFSQSGTGRSGYGPVAAVGAANAPDALKLLREKYKYQFVMVDGYDASGANAKNCANAFDRLGHGAVVCAGCSVLGAWKEDP